MPAPLTQDEMIGHAMALAHDVWLESARTSSILAATGEPLRALPRLDYADAERRAELGRKLLERAEPIDLKALPHELELTVRVAIDRAQAWKRQADWYWLVFDPLGLGFYALFAPTAYGGGFLLSGLVKEFVALPLKARGDRDRYLSLVSDYADLLRQMLERTQGQAERGIHMPKVQLAQAGGGQQAADDAVGQVHQVHRFGDKSPFGQGGVFCARQGQHLVGGAYGPVQPLLHRQKGCTDLLGACFTQGVGGLGP